MAVERKEFSGNAHTIEPAESNRRLKRILDSIAQLEELFHIEDNQILDEYRQIIDELVDIEVPKSAADIKEFQINMMTITEIMERIIRKSPKADQIFIECLQMLYTTLLSHENPAAGSGFIFDIYELELIPKAIKILAKSSAIMGTENDRDLKRVTVTLCNWLRTFSRFKNLSYCIIHLLNGFRDLQKFALLMEIADEVIVQLCISLIIPVVRPNSMKVLSHILCSAQSRELFQKIVPRIPKVISAIKNTPSESTDYDLQHFIDLVSVFVNRYNICDGTFDLINAALKDHKPSENAPLLLNVKTWHFPISYRDSTTPIGLVNMGNTCYMNSVLQALFMTKELTHDILTMKLPSKIINYVQQLVSIMLYSERNEVAPQDMLSVRPQSFRFGHQQDSFEYLGYLLDQLHEEEKRCRLNAMQNGMTANSKQLNGTQTETQTSTSVNLIKIEKMDVDETVQSNQSTILDSPPLTDESDSAINIDDSKTVNESKENIQTMVQNLFGGRLSVNYKCLKCSSQSTNIDNFFDLQLSFPQQSNESSSLSYTGVFGDRITYTTQSLINTYFTTEQMIDEDKYYCDKCKELCDGERDIKLQEGPPNLILVIKHFKYDRNYHVRRKLLHKVNHDEIVSLVVHTTNNTRIRMTYKLYAVIVHSGTNIDSGHYYTYAENHPDQWFKFNDSHISSCSLNDIKNSNNFNTPYILFYKLMGSQAVVEHEDMDGNSAGETDFDTITSSPIIEFCGNRKEEHPRWEDLPPRLQEFVRRHNLLYQDQARYRRFFNTNNEMFNNYYNKHRRSDNDQDPPSSSSGNIVDSVD